MNKDPMVQTILIGKEASPLEIRATEDLRHDIHKCCAFDVVIKTEDYNTTEQ